MSRFVSRVLGIGACLALLAVASAGMAAQSVNVTGKWILDVQTDAGSGTPTLTFKQDGEKLTGHYSGQLGENEITGTIKGNAITFGFQGDFGGQTLKVTYTGTVEKDSMKGSVDLGGMASGTFTGKKQ